MFGTRGALVEAGTLGYSKKWTVDHFFRVYMAPHSTGLNEHFEVSSLFNTVSEGL